MSEPIYMNIEIGGTLPASLVEEFLDLVICDIDNVNGSSTSEEDLIKEVEDGKSSISYNGTANYGLCNGLTTFCETHGLPYIHHSEACGEYNASTSYWFPGMTESKCFDTDSNESPTIRVHQVKPYTDLMYAILLEGKEALPKFINDDRIRVDDLVKLGLDDYSKFLIKLKEELDEALLVEVPEVPPFLIDLNS